MENQSIFFTVSKRIIFTGFAMAFIWQSLQITFFNYGWAIPGQTAWTLLFLQTSGAFVLLFLSFKHFQDHYNDNLPFKKYLQIGFLTGIFAAVFGLLFFLLYSNIFHPNYESWLNEMYLQSWVERGLSDLEIKQQISTNAWLKTPSGMVYSVFFISSLTFILSIIPAVWCSKNNLQSNTI